MDFTFTIEENFRKLQNMDTVTMMWKEIISGKEHEISTDDFVLYSFHYPVDTDVYLEELNNKFDDSFKDCLRTIQGDVKVYLQTFLYYCMCASDRIYIRSSLHAAHLYMKIISLPSDIGHLYFEKQLYKAVIQVCLRSTQEREFHSDNVLPVCKAVFEYASNKDLDIDLFQGTSKLFIMLSLNRQQDHRVESKCENIESYSFWCLKELIQQTEDPIKVKCVMEGILYCFRSKPLVKNVNDRIAVIKLKQIIQEALLSDPDNYKIQYFIDALFSVWTRPEFESTEECVDVINMLGERYYKEVLRKMSYYLESKNHKNGHGNLMQIIYHMLINLPAIDLAKLDVFYSVCLKSIFLHVLNKSRNCQERAIDVLARIFQLKKNQIIENMLNLINLNGNIATLEISEILSSFCNIIEDKYSANAQKTKQILIIVSSLLTAVEHIDGDFGAKIIYLLCKDCTPFSLKSLIPNFHALYLKLSVKKAVPVCRQVLKVFFKNAMHQDPASSAFLEHLYNALVFPSNINGAYYPPECYSNSLLCDDFEYNLMFVKCSNMIRYDHIRYTIDNFNYAERGHSILLNCLLQFVVYKEYSTLTNYIEENYHQLCLVESAGMLFYAYSTILKNNTNFQQGDLAKFNLIHGLLWRSLFERKFVVCNIKPVFNLINKLREILDLGEETMSDDLMTLTAETAYRTLVSHRLHLGSPMYLTELCVVLRRAPQPEIVTIFENVMRKPETMNLLKTHCKDTLIQLLSFFVTLAMLNKRKVPIAMSFLKEALEVEDVIVKLVAIKLMYSLCTEITHEFEDVIKYTFKYVTNQSPCLSRLCVIILEELIHDNYVLLNSEDFLRFIYRLSCQELHTFMKYLLEKRFMLSNKLQITKYYLTSLVYLSGYSKFDNFRINSDFEDDLLNIRALSDCPNDFFSFIFRSISIRNQFNILNELTFLLDNLISGTCKVDESYFIFLKYSLYTFKIMTGKDINDKYERSYYAQVCRCIDKQILNKDNKSKSLAVYGEYEKEVKRCTMTLLKLLFVIQRESLMSEVIFPLFDTVMCWIDHVTPELVYYVHYEKAKEFNGHLVKLIVYYKSNKERLENLANNQIF